MTIDKFSRVTTTELITWNKHFLFCFITIYTIIKSRAQISIAIRKFVVLPSRGKSKTSATKIQGIIRRGVVDQGYSQWF